MNIAGIKPKKGFNAGDTNRRYDVKPFGSKPQNGANSHSEMSKCGGYMLTGKQQKTKLCPYCGANVNLQKAQRVAAASTALEASEMLRKLKSQQGFNRKP
jgi:PHP family Zn ribbon phosphoesterase